MKIKLSKSQWETIGSKAGWKISEIIPSDGILDGGTPYTDEEMVLMKSQEVRSNKINQIKEEISRVVDEFNDNLLSEDGLELRMKELVEKMYAAKGTNQSHSAE